MTLLNRLQNSLFRRRFQDNLARDLREAAQSATTGNVPAARNAESMNPDDDAIGRMWNNISAALPVRQKAASSLPGWRALVLGPALAGTAAGLLLIVLQPARPGEVSTVSPDRPASAGQDQVWDGVKSATAPQTFQNISALRYAIIGSDGSVTPGDGSTRVQAGSNIIFSAEASGVSRKTPLIVSLKYSHQGKTGTIIESYGITQEREILRGNSGYVAFTPQAPGDYIFTIESVTTQSAGSAPADPGKSGDSVHAQFKLQVSGP